MLALLQSKTKAAVFTAAFAVVVMQSILPWVMDFMFDMVLIALVYYGSKLGDSD